MIVLLCESFERVRKADDVINEICTKRFGQFFLSTRLSHYSNQVRMGISNKLNFKSVFLNCAAALNVKKRNENIASWPYGVRWNVTLSAFKISRPWHHNRFHLISSHYAIMKEIKFLIFTWFVNYFVKLKF